MSSSLSDGRCPATGDRRAKRGVERDPTLLPSASGSRRTRARTARRACAAAWSCPCRSRPSRPGPRPASTRNETPGEKSRKTATRGEFLRFQHERSGSGPSRGTAAFGSGRTDAPPGGGKSGAIIADAPRDPCAHQPAETSPTGSERLAIMALAHPAWEPPMPDTGNSRRLARVSPAIPAGQDLGPADQAAHQPARPRARLHARRRGRVRRDRPRSRPRRAT